MFIEDWKYYDWKHDIKGDNIFIDRIYELDLFNFTDKEWQRLFEIYKSLPNYLGSGRWLSEGEIFLWASIETYGLNICGNIPLSYFLKWEKKFHFKIRKLKFNEVI